MSSPPHATVPPDLRDAIGSACVSFERAWNEGDRPVIEDRLAAVPEAARSLLAVELLRIELEYRCRRGEQSAVAEYGARFPAFAGALGGWLAGARAAVGLAAWETSADRADSVLSPPGLSSPGRPPDGGGPPARLGDYELLERLGAGGMGEVYKARQHGLNRLVAPKRVHPDRSADPEALARFRQEAEAVARLQHPHIVQIHAWGEQDGPPFFVLEYTVAGRKATAPHPQPLSPELGEGSGDEPAVVSRGALPQRTSRTGRQSQQPGFSAPGAGGGDTADGPPRRWPAAADPVAGHGNADARRDLPHLSGSRPASS